MRLLNSFSEAVRRHREQLAITTGRSRSLSRRYRETTDQLREAERVCATLHRRLDNYQQAEAQHRVQLDSLRDDSQARRDCHQQDSRELGELRQQISHQEAELAALNSTENRCASQMEELDQLIATAEAELAQFEQAKAELAATQLATRKRLDTALLNLDESEQSATETHDNLVRQRERLIGVQDEFLHTHKN